MHTLRCIVRRAVVWVLLVFASPAHAAPSAGSAASFYVPQLPGLPNDPTRPLHVYAGHLPSDGSTMAPPSTNLTPHLYFLLVKARRTADRERVILWFNGGPGCSSFDGSMMEVGAWRVNGNGGLKQIEGGWEEYANIVYIDQPVGTGFSYASTDKYVHELGEAATQLIQFMRNFYDVFPEFESMDTYLAGESYAGQYIPYFADAFLRTNRIHSPLKGIAIGNGWIDGRSQYPAYYEFAQRNNMIKPGTDQETRSMAALKRCQDRLNETTSTGDPVNIGDCEAIMGTITDGLIQSVDGKKVCLNVYDIRLVDDWPACGMNWPPDLADVYTYLRRPDVVTSLHATAKSEAWVECAGRVGQQLTLTNSPASVTLLPGILEHIPVMLFAGDQDFICNYVGQERLIEALTWNGAKGLGAAETLDWTVNGSHAGTWVTSRNLTYVKVAGASHMVGFDVPVNAQDMMLRFMGVDFHALTGGSASVSSSVGDEFKPALITDDRLASGPSSPSHESSLDPSIWRSYYNSGTTALVLVLIALGIGLIVYCAQRRRRRLRSMTAPRDLDTFEESILLHTIDIEGQAREPMSNGYNDGNGYKTGTTKYSGVGDETGTAIFDVGEDLDEEGDHIHTNGRQ